MNDLIKTVYNLKHELEIVKKELNDLKTMNGLEKTVFTTQLVEPLEWLHNNKESSNIDEWCKNIIKEEKYLDLLDERTLYDILYIILEQKNIPIYVINNKYYTYLNNKWNEITFEHVNNYCQKILSNFWNIFLEWQNKNINKIKIDDYIQRQYHTRLQNICNKTNKSKILNKIRDNLLEKISI